MYRTGEKVTPSGVKSHFSSDNWGEAISGEAGPYTEYKKSTRLTKMLKKLEDSPKGPEVWDGIVSAAKELASEKAPGWSAAVAEPVEQEDGDSDEAFDLGD